MKYYTVNDGVKQAVLSEIKRRVPPGSPVSKEDLKVAYRIVRHIAVMDTIIWKKNHIDIEETNI